MKREDAIKTEIIEVCKRMYQGGFAAANDGNVSVKISKDKIVVTPTGKSKGFLKQKDLLLINLKGKILKGSSKPTTELAMHLFIYQKRKDVKAVVHAHPPCSTAFAVAAIGLDKYVLPEVIVSLGNIPLAKYATPSTKEVPDSISNLIKNHDAILLKNHGVVTVGKNVKDAYHKLERVEHFAKILYLAKGLGKIDELTDKDVKKLMKLGSNTGV